jgi:hypothetical protein
MTLFTIRHLPGSGYAVATICLSDGGIGGAGFFASPERAETVIRDAYKTPLCKVDEATYRAARDVLRESGVYGTPTLAREAVLSHA